MEMFSFRGGVVPPSWSDLNTEPFFVIRPVFWQISPRFGHIQNREKVLKNRRWTKVGTNKIYFFPSVENAGKGENGQKRGQNLSKNQLFGKNSAQQGSPKKLTLATINSDFDRTRKPVSGPLDWGRGCANTLWRKTGIYQKIALLGGPKIIFRPKFVPRKGRKISRFWWFWRDLEELYPGA